MLNAKHEDNTRNLQAQAASLLPSHFPAEGFRPPHKAGRQLADILPQLDEYGFGEAVLLKLSLPIALFQHCDAGPDSCFAQICHQPLHRRYILKLDG